MPRYRFWSSPGWCSHAHSAGSGWTRSPAPRMAEKVRRAIESDGDHVTDLHLWRLGPGHLGAIVSVATSGPREPAHYRKRLATFADLSHVTVEVQHSHAV